MDIFTPRINYRPYEYPELIQFKEAIRHSYKINLKSNQFLNNK